MKVTLIGHYPPPYGGVASLIAQVEVALRSEGFTVEVFNLGTGSPSGTHVTSFNTTNRAVQFLQLLRAFLASRSELFHYFSASYRSFWLGMLCVALAKLRGRRCVVSLVGGSFKDFVEGLRPFARSAAAAGLRVCDALIACNSEIEEVVSGLAPKKRVWRMSNRFAPSQGDSSVPDDLKVFVDSHSPVVSCTGAASREYGLPDALDAVARLRNEFPRIGLVLVLTKYGGASYEADLRDAVLLLGLGQHVSIQKDLPSFVSLLKRSDAFLRTTLVDGDSVSVREALCLGVPTVASDTPFRPRGVILYRKGETGDLAAKLGGALRSKGGGAPSDIREEGDENLSVLLEVYSSAVRPSRS
ncbi:MAG: glycosyltransferase [Candidatus Eisenbacteria bacterium]